MSDLLQEWTRGIRTVKEVHVNMCPFIEDARNGYLWSVCMLAHVVSKNFAIFKKFHMNFSHYFRAFCLLLE